MNWHQAVKNAINRLILKTGNKAFNRQMLLNAEAEHIGKDTASKSQELGQTTSRVLQELRDEGFLYFLDRGEYLLTNSPIPVEEQELSESDIDGLIEKEQLAIGTVETANPLASSRRRIGQQRIRKLSLYYYDHTCAVCDIHDDRLLIAGHITRWSDDAQARGRLCNVICLCRFHDILFEMGYISLADNYTILKKPNVECRSIQVNLDTAEQFRPPVMHPPDLEYLLEHRQRTGFGE